MSDTHNDHESAIKTPKQLVVAILAAILVPIVIIVLLAHFVTDTKRVGVGSDAQTPEAIAARLKPVADENFTFKDVNAPKQLLAGADVYKSTCFACHAAGLAGAPKVGDKAAWGSRIAQGYSTLVEHAVKGIRAMPAKGGNPDLDDIEIAGAVAFMANQAGAKFKEPDLTPATRAAASAAAAPAK
jgi:cytochrome c5